MKNTFTKQLPQNVFVFQLKATKTETTPDEVWQDKIADSRDRGASDQPAVGSLGGRAARQSRETHRLQNPSVSQERTVPITLHVRPIVKDRILEIAKAEGLKTSEKKPLSVSEVGGKYLDRGLQAHMDMEYGALLEPVIARIMEKHLGAMRNQLRWLLVRVAFDGNQTRSLVTNIFSRQPGISKEAREKILIQTAKAAKDNIFGKTPQLSELVKMFDMQLESAMEKRPAN